MWKEMKHMEKKELENAVEAILFASGEPVSIKDIARALNTDEKSAGEIINSLREKCRQRGIEIIYIEDCVQMCTNPKYFSYIKSVCNLPKKKTLSFAMLETLAVIAYKQPVTKSEIEAIRGVNSDRLVNTLVQYNLVCEAGRRLDAAGRPMLFVTSDEFLRHFGFSGIKALPELTDENDS